MAPTHQPSSSKGPGSWPQTSPPSLLIAVVDLHPLSWSLLSSLSPSPGPETGEKDKAPVSPITVTEFATILMVFLNAHLASRWGNEVVVYGASAGKAVLLYPPPEGETEASRPNPNFYRPFQLLDSRFEERLKELAEVPVATEQLNEPPSLVSALTKALCYINRRKPAEAPVSALTAGESAGPSGNSNPEAPETRILVLNATPGGAEGTGASESKASGGAGGQKGYVGLMNLVFAAQKIKIPIDVLTLPPESTRTAPPIFLQQAAHLTNGIYWRWNGRGGLLQYLHSIYLPPPSLRHQPFTLPPQDAVDFRAVCFCHNNVVDVGFVCSVCLSIYCEVRPICLMCKTRYNIRNLKTIKEMAAGVTPIPLPSAIPPPRQNQKKARPVTNGTAPAPAVGEAAPVVKAEPEDVIVIDD
ncbi:RNA polymerase II transcription factor B subunit 4 [Vanrija albida]|uniref:General transcription and DNA repair factor IIH subunit TFB4 n=1 Tax=Vanrija albida TaxID=181172 RepID=A0ABR3QCQ1_9TREE